MPTRRRFALKLPGLSSGLRNGDVPSADKANLSELIAARTRINQADAQKRVDDVIAKAKDSEVKLRQAADTARKTAAACVFAAVSMLIGAFIAATIAGLARRVPGAPGRLKHHCGSSSTGRARPNSISTTSVARQTGWVVSGKFSKSR
jgi:hypothetical protein